MEKIDFLYKYFHPMWAFLQYEVELPNDYLPISWVGGVLLRIPVFHAGGRGFDSHINQS